MILALVMVYEYFPGAKTLYDAHLKEGQVKAGHFSRGLSGPVASSSSSSSPGEETYGPGVPERTLWSYICQIASAIKVVHDAGYAVRMIDPTKVLLTGKNRYVLLCRSFTWLTRGIGLGLARVEGSIYCFMVSLKNRVIWIIYSKKIFVRLGG